MATATDLINESRRINGPKFAEAEALRQFNAECGSVYNTHYSLTIAQAALVKKATGREVVSLHKNDNTNDHYVLAVSREMARRTLDKQMPVDEDQVVTLHIGATMREWGHWGKNRRNHHVYMNLKESKDSARMVSDLSRYVVKRLKNLGIENFRTNSGTSAEITFDSVQEMLTVLCKGDPAGERIHLSLPNRGFGRIVAEDCLYSMSPEEFLGYFKYTGAQDGYATLFYPDAFKDEFAVESPTYHLTYDIIPDQVSKFVKKYWPLMSAFTPLMPAEFCEDLLIRMFETIVSLGKEGFLAWLSGIASAHFPLVPLLGNIFDIGKFGGIFTKFFERFKFEIKKAFLMVNVTWKGEAISNGYRHPWYNWWQWLRTRRISDGATCVDYEVIASYGEMYVIKFYKSDGKDPIVFTPGLPESKRYVRVARLSEAFDPILKRFNDNFNYFSVLAEDWFKAYNWAMAEPIESLDFATVCTTVNRIRGGLSLNSNVLVEPMAIQSADVVDFALSLLLEVFRAKNVIAIAETDAEWMTGYQTNAKRILEIIAKGATIIATGGLVIPAIFFCKWLLDSNPNYVFCIVPEVAKREVVSPVVLAPSAPCPIPVQIPSSSKVAKSDCHLCDLQKTGLFGSQEFVCDRAQSGSLLDMSLDALTMTAFHTYVLAARTWHIGKAGQKLLNYIKEFEEWVEAAIHEPPKLNTELSFITGGPGTGKSVVIRELANYYERNGMEVGIVFPFSDLKTDYKNAKLLDGSVRDFDAETPWWATSFSNKQVLIIDEATGMREDYIRALATRLGTKKIFLVGDRAQTHLSPENNEGTDPTHTNAAWPWESIAEHALVWNFRCNPWVVKFLNYREGYRMRSNRLDYDPPEFISMDEYKALKGKIDRQMVFAHDAAGLVFGSISRPGPSEVFGEGEASNLSVRSSQGKTCNYAAVSCSQADYGVMKIHGMKCVAISRARKKTYVVYVGSKTDAHVAEFMRYLCVDTEENVKMIKSLPYPDRVVKEVSFERTPEQFALEAYVKAKRLMGKVCPTGVGHEEAFSIPDATLATSEKKIFETQPILRTVEMQITTPLAHMEGQEPIEFQYNLMSQVLNPCGTTVLFNSINPILHYSVKHSLVRKLEKVFSDPNVPISGDLTYGWKVTEVGQDAQGMISEKKFNIPLAVIESILKEYEVEYGLLITLPNYATLRYTPGYELHRSKFFRVTSAHIEEIVGPHPEFLSTVDFGTGPTVVKMHDKFYGEFVANWPQKTPKKKATKASSVGYVWMFESIPPPNVGYVPSSYADFKSPAMMSRKHFQLATAHLTTSSMRVANPLKTEWLPAQVAPRIPKLRAGTNAYMMAKLIDPSGACPQESMNYNYVLKGPTRDQRLTISFEGLIFGKTKAGKIRRHPDQVSYSITKGYGLHYRNTPAENIIAAQRLGNFAPKPILTAESKYYIEKIVDEAFEENWYPNFKLDEYEINALVLRSLRDFQKRNYGKRADGEKARWIPRVLATMMNKAQFKPTKGPTGMKLEKGGQGILQTTAQTSLEFCGWMRSLNLHFKRAAKPHFFYDNATPTSQFKFELSSALRALPASAQFGIMDAVSFDSQQNECTVYLEKYFRMRQGAVSPVLDAYYKIREPVPFIMYGAFKGKTNWEKGSGFPDTLLGNTTLEAVAAEQVFQGVGPKVVAAKGDDVLRAQSGLIMNDVAKRNVERYLGMQWVCDIGRGGEFTGNTVSASGCYTSISRAALKAVASRARDYKEFATRQQSYRDRIQEIMSDGLEETIAANMEAEGKTENYIRACFEVLNSLGHINKKTWEEITNRVVLRNPNLPSAFGPSLI